MYSISKSVTLVKIFQNKNLNIIKIEVIALFKSVYIPNADESPLYLCCSFYSWNSIYEDTIVRPPYVP